MSGAGDLPFVAVPPTGGGEATVFHCGLCGTDFSHGEEVCGRCPLHAGCDLVKCPRCGYQFPRRSRVIDWGRTLLARAGVLR